MAKKARYYVIHETIAQSWARDASTFALGAAFMAPGLIVGSSALQWLGGLIFLAALAGRASAFGYVCKTTAEVREELDRIDAQHTN